MPTGIYNSPNRRGGQKGRSGVYVRTKPVWNKGKKTGIAPWRGKKRPEMTGKNHPLWGKPRSQETKEKIKKKLSGRKLPEEQIRKMKLRIGDKSSNWKGGITPLELQIRHCYRYRQWVSDVFTKDDFTCQDCGIRGGRLVAHHIKLFNIILKENNIKTLEEALNCSELWDINNGITYCENYHREKANHKRK